MFPEIDKTQTRTAILHGLKNKVALTAQEIYELIEKNQNQNISYAAVYKVLHNMTAEGKLVKQSRQFSINTNWLAAVKEFIEEIERKQPYKTTKHFPSLNILRKGDSVQTFLFKKFNEAEDYRKRLQQEYISKKRKHPHCAIYKHLRSPILYLEKSLDFLSELEKKKMESFLVVSGNTVVDQWCEKFYTSSPRVYVKINSEPFASDEHETMILGDIVVQLFIHKTIQNYIEKTYKGTKTLDNFDIIDFFRKTHKGYAPTKITVFRNPQIAEHLRQQILQHFKQINNPP